MRKLVASVLIALLMLAAVPFGAAASVPGEEVVGYRVFMGYVDIWKNSRGDWISVGGRYIKPGTKNVVLQGHPSVPTKYADQTIRNLRDLLDKYTLTRVEAKPAPFTEEEYLTAGGRWGEDSGQYVWIDWAQFEHNYLNMIPDQIKVIEAKLNQDDATVELEWSVDIPGYPPGAVAGDPPLGPLGEPLDLTHPLNRHLLDPQLFPPDVFADMVEGWRFWVPTIVTWYGIPLEQEVDVYVEVNPKQTHYTIPASGGSVTPSADIIVSRNDNLDKKVTVVITVDGPAGEASRTVTLGPDDTWQGYYEFTTSMPSTFTIWAIAEPDAVDKNMDNNFDSCDIIVDSLKPDIGPGEPDIRGGLRG